MKRALLLVIACSLMLGATTAYAGAKPVRDRAAGAAFTAAPTVLSRGEATPGLSALGAVFSDVLTGYIDEDWSNLYQVDLAAGETLRVSLTGDPGTDFDLYLYEPGADWETDLPVTQAWAETYPDSITYTALVDGIYTLEVYAAYGSGDYTLNYSISEAVPVVRVAGTTRYDVAANLARKGWDPNGDKMWAGVQDIIVACGDNGKEADPLAAAGLAGVYDCPVLLTGVTSLPASTKTVITEIAATNPGVKVHLIGGVNSVPDARWNTIKAISGVSPEKDRIFGQSRYDVSAAIAQRMVLEAGVGSLGGVLIVAGDNTSGFYDALAASPIAYANTMPILSVQKGVVPNSVAYLLNGVLVGAPRYVVNSSTYVSDATRNKVGTTTRLTTSSNRYTAASQIAAAGITRGWLDPASTAVAAKLPDALTGGVFSGKNGGVMLFTDSTSVIQPATKSFITARKVAIYNGWVLGGTNSVPSAQETSFRNLVK